MSDQPECLNCGKPYYKNEPENREGCQCPPEDKIILTDVPS